MVFSYHAKRFHLLFSGICESKFPKILSQSAKPAPTARMLSGLKHWDIGCVTEVLLLIRKNDVELYFNWPHFTMSASAAGNGFSSTGAGRTLPTSRCQ